MTQKELAEKVGVSQSYLSEILNKKRTPSKKLAKKLADITGLDRDFYLFPDEFDINGIRKVVKPNRSLRTTPIRNFKSIKRSSENDD